jgi:hypothetical protein
MKATITVTMDNAAFEDRQSCETARILRELADKLDSHTVRHLDGTKLYDTDGNAVGTFKLSGKGA